MIDTPETGAARANSRGEIVRPPPIPLPATTQEMLDQRKRPSNRTLNDMVEEVHTALYKTAVYKRLLDAVWDSDAVEGSLMADNFRAADMIREEAKKRELPELASKNWATISKCLGVVLRRFDMDRRRRRNMVHGEVVPENGEPT